MLYSLQPLCLLQPLIKKTKVFFRTLPWLIIVVSLCVPGYPASATKSLSSAYDLIAAVNGLRAARGLPAYQVNGALMAAAQRHSEYQAATGTATHTGKGGSNAKSRAIAAGYGDGAAVNVTENIAMGMNMTPQQALSVWQDAVHMATMLSAAYTDAGAGVATSGDMVYYTLDVGYVSGEVGSGAGESSSASAAKSASVTRSAATVVMPIQRATPLADGSLVHIVGEGQTLWAIAATYKVKLPELLAVNHLNEKSLIHPGDHLIIKAAQWSPTDTVTVSETVTATVPATNIPLPTKLPSTPPATETSTVTPSETPVAAPAVSGIQVDPALMMIIGLFLTGSLLLIFGTVLKRSS